MKLAIGCDHGGVKLKEYIVDTLKDIKFIDAGLENFDGDDYPDFAVMVAKKVLSGEADSGVLICGTGIGMSIAANKIDGIRCALIHNEEEAHLAKEHNDANVIALSKKCDGNLAVLMIESYVKAIRDDSERHVRRRKKVIDIENGAYDEL